MYNLATPFDVIIQDIIDKLYKNGIFRKNFKFLTICELLRLYNNTEFEVNLKGKNLKNDDLELLSSINFENSEKIDLSHNKIANIEPINKAFSSTKLRKIDLSYNNVKNIKSLREIMNNNKQLEIIDLENNEIKNLEFLKNIEIKLDNNDN